MGNIDMFPTEIRGSHSYFRLVTNKQLELKTILSSYVAVNLVP